MGQINEEILLEAIVKDDIKAFQALMEEAQCGMVRLGRFPVLSLLYLYKSKRIISAYEDSFIKITNWEEMREPASASKAFSEKAGKCLRLYLNEVVSPLEMLLILDRTKKLKRVYPLAKPSNAVKERLKSIYSVKYSLDIKYEGDDIIIDRRPLSYSEKKKIATACLCSFLAVAIAVATPVTTIKLIPKRVEGEVTKLSQINFGKDTTYTLKNDITLPDNFSVEKMSCTIEGGGKKLILGKGVSLGELAGRMSDLEIESSGSPLFSSISEDGEFSNATVNVNADIETYTSTAFVTVNNFGTIDNVTVNAKGKVSALGTDSESTEYNELNFAAIAANNFYRRTSVSKEVYGIRNCTVNYSDFSLEGEANTNAMFGGVAGVNYGYLMDCTVTGSVRANTFDLAGVCVINSGLLSGSKNSANLTQVSESSGWNPNVGGIAYSNTNTIEYCENTGAITSKSIYEGEDDKPNVIAAGIVCESTVYSSGGILYCKNSGKISAEGNGIAYVGGIAATSISTVKYSISLGEISVKANSAYAGGILGASGVDSDFMYIYCGFAENCISECSISADVKEVSWFGGIVGFVAEKGFEQYVYDDNNLPIKGNDGKYLTEIVYFGGGVRGCFYLGAGVKDVDYFGNIAGGCGEDIYTDEFVTEYGNFKENYYLENSLPAHGAVSSAKGEFNKAESKGATGAKEDEIKALQAYLEILEKLNR